MNIPRLLESTGFVLPEPNKDFRVFAMSEGPEKCGKTDFTLRHSPGPIAVTSMDTGTKALVDKHIAESGKDIWLSQTRVPKAGLSKAEYTTAWKGFEKQHEAVLKCMDVKTYIWDTGTDIWEMFRLMHLGKLTQVKPHHYGPVNAEFRDLIKTMYDERPDLNFIAIHKNKKQYVKTVADKEGSWNGKYERAGFDDFRYLVDVCLQHYYDGGFGVRILPNQGVGARQSADLAGLELFGDDCSFFWLAQNLYPELSPEYWWDGSSNHPMAE